MWREAQIGAVWVEIKTVKHFHKMGEEFSPS